MKTRRGTVKWVLLAGGIALAVLLLFSLRGGREVRIARLVRANEADLTDIAQACLAGEETPASWRGVRVDGVFEGESPIVQFYHSGWGLGSSTTYWGFYYSAENKPAAFQNVDQPLVPSGDGEWTWTDGTDNGGITRRISDGWFYYKAWF